MGIIIVFHSERRERDKHETISPEGSLPTEVNPPPPPTPLKFKVAHRPLHGIFNHFVD